MTPREIIEKCNNLGYWEIVLRFNSKVMLSSEMNLNESLKNTVFLNYDIYRMTFDIKDGKPFIRFII